MSRLIVLVLTLSLMAACASSPDAPTPGDVSAPPPGDGAVRELPKTASNLPALGLTGAASLFAAWGVRSLRRRIF